MLFKKTETLKQIILLLLVSCFSIMNSRAQQIPRFNPDTVLTVYIDSAVTITSTRLDVEAFIREIINDTSFYEAFRNMKRYNFTAEDRIYTYDKKDKVSGKIYRKLFHSNSGDNKIKYLARQDSGKLYKKNGKYQVGKTLHNKKNGLVIDTASE